MRRRGNRRLPAHGGGDARHSLTALRSLWPLARVALGVVFGLGAWWGGPEVGRWAWARLVEAPPLALARRIYEGLHQVSEEDIAAMAQAPIGRPLLAIDLAATARALRQHPWVEGVQVRRILPDTLHIVIREHRPAIWVSLEGLTLADPNGKLFKSFAPADAARAGCELPVFTGLDVARVGRDPAWAAARVRAALAVTRAAALHAPRLGRLEEVHWDEEVGWSIWVQPTAGPPAQVYLGTTIAGGLAHAGAAVQLLSSGPRHAAIIWADGRQHPHRVSVRLAGEHSVGAAAEASWQTDPSSSPASTSAPPKSVPSSAR